MSDSWNDIPRIKEQWAHIGQLEDGWNGFGTCVAPKPEDVQYGIDLLDALRRDFLAAPAIEPLFDGSIKVSWTKGPLTLNVAWRYDRLTEVSVTDSGTETHSVKGSFPRPDYVTIREACEPHLASLTATSTGELW